MLSLEHEALLLEALHPRFQRIVRFALGTGCRLDEIRGIDLERDIARQRGTVHVVGKFREERDVPMQPDAGMALEEQLTERHYVHLLKDDWCRQPAGADCDRAESGGERRRIA